jgi:hypothetical protein
MSGGDLYRDALLGVRARVVELIARISEREAQVTKDFWNMLPRDTREELAELRRARGHVRAESLADLADAEGKLEAYLDQLERLIAELPELEAAWTELPDEVDDPPPPRFSMLEGFATTGEANDVERSFAAMVRERCPEATVRGDSPSYVARFRDHGAPFALRATINTNGNGQVAEVAMFLVTSIPRALAPLVVRHESLVLSVGRVLGLRSEIEVGDPSFDGLFLIEGARAAAAMYLVPAVRAYLLSLARFDVPTLEVDPEQRRASLRWQFEPAPKALEAAVRILRAVRETPPALRFWARALSADGRSRR